MLTRSRITVHFLHQDSKHRIYFGLGMGPYISATFPRGCILISPTECAASIDMTRDSTCSTCHLSVENEMRKDTHVREFDALVRRRGIVEAQRACANSSTIRLGGARCGCVPAFLAGNLPRIESSQSDSASYEHNQLSVVDVGGATYAAISELEYTTCECESA